MTDYSTADNVEAGFRELTSAIHNLTEVIRREGKLNRAVSMLGNPAIDRSEVLKFLEGLK